ncbi:MAG: DUF1282 family protein [Bacteroidaceae bacterium]|nr:DUF1282 family protein [Bacteroidaceae bacterium]
MNYKELFQRLLALIVSPKKAWVEISSESPRRDVMGTFVYPLIALCGLAVLFSKLMGSGMKRLTFQTAAMDICSYCVALFGGFFLAVWLLDLLKKEILKHESDMPGSQLFVGYTMGVVFVAEILSILFPQFFIFKWILQFYVLYVVWEGSEIIFTVPEKDKLTFTILTSVAVIFSPVVIRILFNFISNILG